MRYLALVVLLGTIFVHPTAQAAPPHVLPGTQPLTWQDDIASRLVAGADRFLLREIDQSIAGRAQYWQRDTSSRSAYQSSMEKNRSRLAHILGVRDPRQVCEAMSLVGTTSQSAIIAQNNHLQIMTVRWPVLGRMHGEGLLLVPRGVPKLADVIAIPDADQSPESICGLVEGVDEQSQYARRLAEAGCRVLVPALIGRQLRQRNGRVTLTDREYLYRSAFELGRHLIGYEVQKVLAAVDWFEHESGGSDPRIAVVGWGEGGMLSLYAAALDQRIDVACVSGYFEPREQIWQQPIDRNVFGLLEQFGDAELASMIVPRALIIEAARGPELTIAAGQGGAPAELKTPALERVQAEVSRAKKLVGQLDGGDTVYLVVSGQGNGPYLTRNTLQQVLLRLGPNVGIRELQRVPTYRGDPEQIAQRSLRQMQEIDDYNQWLLRESSYTRAEFMKELDTSSPEAYRKSSEHYRQIFRDEVIGHIDQPLLPLQVSSRLAYDEPEWTGYEVVIDVFPDLFAYGILLLPKDLQPGQRRPVVVCQHGLEGRPQDVVTGDHRAYHDFAAKLAEQGFITFAPQNLYIFGDRFRSLQRKANPLKQTLFSLMVPQHQQIINWLSSLDCVDPTRIGFYGLSYGGKSAMRIPALVPGYCLSICSGDFNEWVWKNASPVRRTAMCGLESTRSLSLIWGAHSITRK